MTPGPWTHYDDTTPAGKTGRHEIVAMGRTVARIYATKGREVDDLDNARLIAAAPDMLAALQHVMADDHGIIPRATSDCRKVVAAAIAKATV